MKRNHVLLLLGLTILLLAVMAGQATQQAEQDASRIRVGLYDNRPKVYHDQHGQPAGLFIDLIQAMAKREHWHLEFVSCEWSECLNLLKAGEIDLMPDVAINEERARQFDFHDIPVTYSWSGIWSQPKLRLLALPDLHRLRIAILRGSVQQKALRKMMQGSNLDYTPVLVDSYEQGFQVVEHGKAHAVVSNSYFGTMNAPRYNLRETPIVFNPATLYYAVPEGTHADLLNRIDHYLEQWRQDSDSPYFRALKQAMVPPGKAVIPEAVRWGLIVSVAAVLILLGMSALLRWQVRRRTQELTVMNYRFGHLLRTSPVMLYQLQVRNDGINPLWISENIPRLFGYRPKDVFVPGWWESVVHPDDLQMAKNALDNVQEKQHIAVEYRIFDRSGDVRHIRDEMHYIPAVGGSEGEIVGSWSDLTEAREQEANLRYLTYYDRLTELPNRNLLQFRIEENIQRARNNKHDFAVLYIDLNRFKHINETLGYETGDEFLRMASKRMGELLGVENTLARMGADEFVMVLKDTSEQQAAETARRLLRRFALPMVVAEHELVVTLSIGISLFPGDGTDADTLLRHAEIALNAAKGEGRNSLHFFSTTLSEGIRERLMLENALRYAVERNELVLHYQPQVRLDTGELVGVEGLVRWQHPELGLISPDKFIPLAEQTGMIGEIGEWVLHESCRQLRQWEQQQCHVPRVAVNLAIQQIESGQLVRQVRSALDEYAIDGRRLELEVTESTIMREPEKATEAMIEFQHMGIKLAIDDFGTGYSSLAYLKRLPLDRLKIDRSFVMDIGEQSGSEAICQTIISLSNSLGLDTVAEGVEQQHHADFLREAGCEIAQGYLFSKPLPPDELAEQCKTRIKSSKF